MEMMLVVLDDTSTRLGHALPRGAVPARCAVTVIVTFRHPLPPVYVAPCYSVGASAGEASAPLGAPRRRRAIPAHTTRASCSREAGQHGCAVPLTRRQSYCQ